MNWVLIHKERKIERFSFKDERYVLEHCIDADAIEQGNKPNPHHDFWEMQDHVVGFRCMVSGMETAFYDFHRKLREKINAMDNLASEVVLLANKEIKEIKR